MNHKEKKRKVDPVLLAAWLLAVVSAFFVHPDKTYFDYIDWRSLGILWSLMVVIQGLKQNAVFEKIGAGLLTRAKKGWQLSAVLIFLCFFSAMLITNDVALITFVPFAMMMLHQSGREDLMIPVVVLQTVAANLGSMLTPVGNPQNLYLFQYTGMPIGEFLSTMFPYVCLTAVLRCLSILMLPGKEKKLEMHEHFDTVKSFGSRRQIGIYTALFLAALFTVVRFRPWQVIVNAILPGEPWKILVLAVFLVVLGMDTQILFRADYALLMTFIGFFIFTGNMGRIDAVRTLLANAMEGRELLVSVLTSQCISNVPATLLLADFTSEYHALLLGVNFGGLGTLIASMASLISYKAYAGAYPDKKGRYLLVFTGINLLYLLVLVAQYVIMNHIMV